MKLGKIYTIPLQDHERNGEVGIFELDVEVDTALFLQSGDKSNLIRRQFAIHLATAILDYHVPIEFWRGTLEDKVAKHTNMPSNLNFGVRI